MNINARNRSGRTTIWYIIKNIEDMSRIIGTDYTYRNHRHDELYNFHDLLFDSYDSFSSRKSFVSDNINKALFALDHGAAMTEDEAKQLDAALSVFAGKAYKNKEKYHGIPFAKLQYLRGWLRKKWVICNKRLIT